MPQNDASKANATKLLSECKAVLSRLGLLYPPSAAANTESTLAMGCVDKIVEQAALPPPTADGSKPRDQVDSVMDLR